MSRTGKNGRRERPSRREVLRKGGSAVAVLAGGAAAMGAIGDRGDATPAPRRRLAMIVELDKCIGCQACAVACKAEHGVRLGGFRTWVPAREEGRYPLVRRHFLPSQCNHCDRPPCLDVCPTGATFRRDDGIVDIDKDKCIGCRHCMGACPYGARYFNPAPAERLASAFPARTPGTVDKCDFCAHRVDNGVMPACVNTCPTGARVFGDLADPADPLALLLSRGNTRPLLPEFGTGPNVHYAGGNVGVFERPRHSARVRAGRDPSSE